MPAPATYDSLIAAFPLRPIRDEVDCRNAMEILEGLVGLMRKTKDQEEYESVLADLVSAYEKARYAHIMPRHDPLGNLEFLMEQHGMNASDLGRLLGVRQLGAAVLRRQRGLSKMHIKRLADYFGVSPAVFF